MIVGGVNVGGASVSVGAGEGVSWVRVGDGAGLALRVRVGLGDTVVLGDEDGVALRGGGFGAVFVVVRCGSGASAVDGSGAGDTAAGEPDGDGDDATTTGGALCGVPPNDQPTRPAATPAGTPQIAIHTETGTRRRRRCEAGAASGSGGVSPARRPPMMSVRSVSFTRSPHRGLQRPR